MSEEQTPEAFVELDLGLGDAAFSGLMDALVPEEAGPPAGETAAEAGATAAPAAGGGAADPVAPGDAAGGAQESAPAAGAPGGAAGGDPALGTGAEGSSVGAAEQPAASGGGADLPASWTADVSVVAPNLGKLTEAIEENTTTQYQNEAILQLRDEHPLYFDALSKHPRTLVGTSVPSLTKDGEEVLRDANDAREWQEAVKHTLTAEINARTEKRLDETRGTLSSVHETISMFQQNKDMVPGTKQFDRELADRFAKMATPYLREVDGKPLGYSIPVQPLIDSIRTQLQQERAAKPAPPAPAAPAAAPAAPVDPPQAGISTKAGNTGGESEDFSTLFGTLGLPTLRI